MLRLGRFTLVLAGVLVAVGLLGGFGAMLAGASDYIVPLIGLVPLGFVLGFAGLAAVVLSEPRR